MNINRRTAMACLGSLVGLPVPKGIDLNAPDEPAHESTPDEIASFAAGQELRGIRSQHPAWWPKLRYTSIVQWCEGVAVVFGVGPAWYCQVEEQRLLPWFAESCDVLAKAHSPGYRSWAAVIACNLSDGIRREVKAPMFNVSRR
ncbi:MAG TPA: hypothetical protein VHZ24_06855 [Pirellulales bacterium]|jgi:hypothetical protein|nr:hypothetical protein [Pirellulales bacterium]